MCLLVVCSQVLAEWPLIVAANRDERLDRPAAPLAVLRANGPKTVGGQDLMAGGTWLAVNEHGVVAGLTNKPAVEGRDPSKRSRGEIPLALTAASTARKSIAAFSAATWPGDYNPCWALVGDRTSLYYVDITQPDHVLSVALGPGVHVLENKPIEEPSPKADHVRRLIGDVESMSPEQALTALQRVLVDHDINQEPADDTDRSRLASRASACCVHSEEYGTRSSMLIKVPGSPSTAPEVWSSDGAACTHPLMRSTPLDSQPSG
jgi:uncharacterized protein with NRDE domain